MAQKSAKAGGRGPQAQGPDIGSAAEQTPSRGAHLIAIDGPSGTGKSTVSRGVASRLGAGYLDTGALYRLITLHVLESGVKPSDSDAVIGVLGDVQLNIPTDPEHQVHLLGGADVTKRIRDADVTAAVSTVAAVPQVRAFLLDRQREIAYAGTMVVEGRDIGTVIAPDAAVKIYLTADEHVRAARRLKQNVDEGFAATARAAVSVQLISDDLRRRDEADSKRATAPLEQAADAVVVDSTHLTVDETIDAIMEIARIRGVPGTTDPRAGAVSGGAGRDHDADDAASRADRPAVSPTFAPTAVGQSRPVHWSRLGGQDDPVPLGRKPRNVDRGRRIGICLSRLMYRMKVRGEKNMPTHGPLLVVANHTTFADGPILFGRLPRRISFLVKAEVLVGPLGWLLRTVGQYAIDRKAPQREVLLAALNQLKAGGVVGIFPEGERTDGSVSSVYRGAGWLAARSGATVVPVALRGTARPAGKKLRRIRPRVYAVVGTAFAVEQGAGKRAITAATEMIQERLAAQVAQLDRGIAKLADRHDRLGAGWRS